MQMRILVIRLQIATTPEHRSYLQGSRMNQQHASSFLDLHKKPCEHYEDFPSIGRAVDFASATTVMRAETSILDCEQLHHYISCVPNVSIQHSRWSYCQHLFEQTLHGYSPESFNVASRLTPLTMILVFPMCDS